MKMKVLFDIPKEIMDGLASGIYVRKGGVIVTKEGHNVVAWLKEAEALGTTGATIHPAVAAAVVAVAVGFIVLNSKLTDIKNLINHMQHDILKIIEKTEEIHDQQIIELFACYKTAVEIAELGIREGNPRLLEEARSKFIQTGETYLGLSNRIIQKKLIVPQHEIYAQHSLLYYFCAQGDIHCSMALNKFETARKSIDKYQNIFSDLAQQFRKELSSATANDIELLTYDQISSLEEKNKYYDILEEYIESNLPIIDCLQKKRIPYLEYAKSMKEYQQSNAVAVLPIG